MRYFFYLFFLGITNVLIAQNATTVSVIQLSDSISETSGLIFINNKIITHNDSGDGPYLYEIDTLTGNVLRTVYISGATSIDWEDICVDNSYIYVGDFGNNLGTRTDLAILKININAFFNTPNDTVNCETINFNFASQTSFVSSQYTTNYDVEAMCSVGDSLIIFSKNWGNSKTNYYSIPKNAGSYAVESRGEINTNGLVTGAVYNGINNEIVLCGYTFSEPFLIRISNFSAYNFSSGLIQRFTLNVTTSSIQVEGITNFNNQGYYLSSEVHSSGNSELLRLSNDNFLNFNLKENIEIIVYPNPSNEVFKINGVEVDYVELINAESKVLKNAYSNTIQIDDLPAGSYFLKIYLKNSANYIVKKVIIK